MDGRKDIDNGSENGSSSSNGGQGKKGLQWTNEKHSKYLRFMEASFVRNMLKTSISDTTSNIKLDRFVPDISESTADLRRSDRVIRTCNRQKRTPMTRPRKVVNDQVVPKLEHKAGDDN